MRTGTGKAKDKASIGAQTPNTQTPSYDEIAVLAFEYWQMRAGRGGSAEDDWFRAEETLRERLRNTEDHRSSTSIGGDLNQFNPRSRTAG